MNIKNAEFIKSYGKINDFQSTALPEIAFVGRSNVGKSSLINFITNRKKLAKTSSLPGRTRLINTFKITSKCDPSKSELLQTNKNGDCEFLLVDLPGYGYAKASKTMQAEWKPLIEGYLKKSTQLINVFVLLDIRHKPNDMDKQMLNFLYYYTIPFTIIATKSDKLKRSELGAYLQMLATEIGVGVKDIIVTSSSENKGHDAMLNKIEEIITRGNANESMGD